MNMISTGAFLNEMDASNKQPTVAEKFAAVWEKKNAKAARAGGVSLMALSLAACGSSSSDTDAGADAGADAGTGTDNSTTSGGTLDLTPLTDIASSTQALTGSLANEFRFTDGNETVNGMSATMAAADTLLDPSKTDADVLNVTITDDTTITTVNIETINLDYTVAGKDFTGANTATTTYNVSGAVAGKISTPASGSEIALNDYGRVLTVEGLTWTGTTTAGSAETMSIALSGATHGTTASTQTGVKFDATGNDNLETLNIASNGSAANTFTLSVNNSETIGKIVTSGAADLTVRAAEGLVDGKTIDATGSTGAVNLSFDTGGGITTNAANWSDIDTVIYRDSDTTAGAATLNNVASGQDIEIANSVSTLTVTAQGATYSALADSASLTLNGTSTTAGVTVTTYNAQNMTTLNLASQGLASSTSTTAANTISNLDGDFSTITITGDTSLAISDLDIEAKEAASSTSARAVTLDASGMTGNAFVSITASADAKVSYTMTGTDGADTLVANASGSSLTGGAGKDTLTGGDGVDTINGGAAADHIDVSYGKDVLTGGAGNDTYDVDSFSASAVAQVTTSADVDGGKTGATADSLVVVVDGVTYTQAVLTATDTGDDIAADFVASFGDAILGAHGVTVAVTSTVANTSGLLKFTGKSDGTSFTVDLNYVDDTTVVTMAETATTTGAAAKDVISEITDFAAGDILDLAGGLTEAGISYYEGAAASSAAANNIYVLTDASGFADAEAAEDAVAAGTISTDTADGIFVFINSTLGHAQVVYDGDIDTDSANLGAYDGDAVLFNLTSITNVTDLAAAFSADSFTI